MNQPEYIIEPLAGTLAERLADDVARMLDGAIAERGNATLVVSGGSTPVPFFAALSTRPVDWSRVKITLADERWVAPEHPDSNERLVRRHLLTNKAADATLVGLYLAGQSAAQAEREVEARLREQVMPFDVVVLGMGDDGHTASIFPDSEGLHDLVDLNRTPLCAAAVPPNARHKRMTLTLKALVDTRYLLVHITGQRKRSVLEYALIDGLVEKAPVAALFLQNAVPVTVYWADDAVESAAG